MNRYLEETKPAVSDLIALLARERRRLEDQFHTQERMAAEEKRLFDLGKKDGFTTELVIDIHGFKMAADRYGTEAIETQQLLVKRKAAYDAIAAAILQIAKQGLSLTHGPLVSCPPGRLIGRQPLSTVIWQARNQAVHYDEPPYRNPVIVCFASLEAEFGAKFRLGSTSLAALVVQMLRWDDYVHYERDMFSLLPL